MKDFEQLFEEVAEQIDWSRIEKTMKLLNWTWANEEITIYSLIKTAKSLCEDSYKNGKRDNIRCYCATGGFHAFYFPEYNELSLFFVVEDASSYGEYEE